MRALAAIMIFLLAYELQAAEVPREIQGTWVVTSFHLGGMSALSNEAAKSWLGRTMTIGQRCVSLGGKVVRPFRIYSTKYDSDTYFRQAFRTEPSQVGYKAPKVREYVIVEAEEKPWLEPGGTIVVINKEKALTVWDGVFFVLTRNAPNPQGGANGRQPLSSDTNRTSAAAASRRLP
jgi:hypothetical protein